MEEEAGCTERPMRRAAEQGAVQSEPSGSPPFQSSARGGASVSLPASVSSPVKRGSVTMTCRAVRRRQRKHLAPSECPPNGSWRKVRLREVRLLAALDCGGGGVRVEGASAVVAGSLVPITVF